MDSLTSADRVNGTPHTSPTRSSRKPAAPASADRRSARKPARKPSARKTLSACRWAASIVGGTAAGMLALSVTHCTDGIAALTGSPHLLAGLMAVGLDVGMVSSELAIVASHGTDAGKAISPWATGYIAAAVLLSALLNSYAFAQHAPAGMAWAAVCLGIVLPALIYVLGRVSASLWLAK